MKKYTLEELQATNIYELRSLAAACGSKSPTSKRKDQLIEIILCLQDGKPEPYASKKPKGRPRLPTLDMPTEHSSMYTVEQDAPNLLVPPFFSLPAQKASRFLKLSENSMQNNPTSRIIDAFCPVMFGQRVIISSPLFCKQQVLDDILTAIKQNYGQAKVYYLACGTSAHDTATETLCINLNDDTETQIRSAEQFLVGALNQVNDNNDVIVFVDSLSYLTKIFNSLPAIKQHTYSIAKNVLGVAKNTPQGSLTVFATVDADNQSLRAVADEYVVLSDSNIVLDSELYDAAVCPPIDIRQSRSVNQSLTADGRIHTLYGLRQAAKTNFVVATLELINDIKNNKSLI